MKKRVSSLFLILTLLFSLTACARPEKNVGSGELILTFLDVGQADCTFITCGGESMLIDAGNVDDGELVVSYLTGQGVEYIDYVVCTHAHEDHGGGMAAVMANFSAGEVLSPVKERDTRFFNNFVKYTEAQGLEITVPFPGDSFALGGGIVTVLGPTAQYDETNNTSIVLRLDYGSTSFLFTGDMERDAEQDLIGSGAELRADVLKVGHHGSSTSTSYVFLREVMPEYAVISCGKDNSYGHPHEETLSRLRDEGAELYRTDMQGTITCVSDGEHLTFTTQTYVPETNPTKSDGSGQNSQAADYYIGNKNSKVYHVPSCSGLPAEKNRVIFETLTDAVSSGYSPCSRCLGE